MTIRTITPERQQTAIPEHECRVFRHAAELTGKKWSAAILLAMQQGAERFSDIRAAVDGLSDRLLTLRLRELEQHGLVQRTVIPTVPTQVHYGLTDAGSELIRILQPLVDWAHRWEPSTGDATAPSDKARRVDA